MNEFQWILITVEHKSIKINKLIKYIKKKKSKIEAKNLHRGQI